MANIPPEALAAAFSAAAKTPPPGYVPDPAAQNGGGGAPTGGDPTQTDPTQTGGPSPNPTQDPTQDPNAVQGQDPNSQAVWQEFPATDPTQVEQLAQQMQQGGDPQALVEMLSGFMQQAQADQDKLSQMHTAMLSHLMDLLQGPQGGGQPLPSGPSPVASQGPGVGGAGSGY